MSETVTHRIATSVPFESVTLSVFRLPFDSARAGSVMIEYQLPQRRFDCHSRGVQYVAL